MKKLTLKSLQKWLDVISPVKVEITKTSYDCIVKKCTNDSYFNSSTNILLNNENYYIELTFWVWVNLTKIEIYFSCWNKFNNEYIKKENKWFNSI